MRTGFLIEIARRTDAPVGEAEPAPNTRRSNGKNAGCMPALLRERSGPC